MLILTPTSQHTWTDQMYGTYLNCYQLYLSIVIGRMHGAPYRGYRYVPLRFGVGGGNVVRRMGTQQQQFIYLSAHLSVLIYDFLRQRSRSKILTTMKGFFQRGKPFPLTYSTYTQVYSPSCTSETQKQHLKL